MTDSVATGTPDDCLLILSDSLAYFGPQGGLPADDARIWPNIVGARCGLPVRLFGRIGWTSRDVWWAMTQDPNIWAAVPHARAVILAFGGMDSLPSPLPTALREQIRYVRPGRLRQIVRSAYQLVQPRASKIGWPVALPPSVTVDYLDKIHEALTQLRPDLPMVVCLPSTHRSPYYGYVHTGRIPTTAAMRAWCDRHGVSYADFYPPTRDAYDDPDAVNPDAATNPDAAMNPDAVMNPDGIHWGFACHRAVADVVAEPVLRVLDDPDVRAARRTG